VFIEAKEDGSGGDNWATGAVSRAKLQSNHHHQQTNIQFFYRPDALPVAQPTVSKHLRESKKITLSKAKTTAKSVNHTCNVNCSKGHICRFDSWYKCHRLYQKIVKAPENPNYCNSCVLVVINHYNSQKNNTMQKNGFTYMMFHMHVHIHAYRICTHAHAPVMCKILFWKQYFYFENTK